jgi:hypothetical protein
MQSLEHRALAQTARTQFKERQQSMARGPTRVTCIPDITQISAFPGSLAGPRQRLATDRPFREYR